MSGYSLRHADIHCKSYTLAWSTLVSIAGRLPPIDSSLFTWEMFSIRLSAATENGKKIKMYR